MKQFFTFAIAGLLTFSLHAQTPVVDKATPGKMIQQQASAVPSMANRDIIWSNDISNCADWTFGNAADAVGAPWSDIDLNFECTPNGPTGPYNGWAGANPAGSQAPGINSTSGGNFLMIDSDLFGADANYDANWVENSWVQTAAPIDCSVNPYVAISFETRYRCWDNGGSDGSEKCFVEISRDGTTWPDLTQTYVTTWEDEGLVVYGTDTVQCRYEVFPDSETGFETDNPSYREFDITEAAGNQSTVWIRFRWVGTWGYSWEIDDINVVDIEENDTRIDSYLSYTNYFQTGVYENGAWAQSQLLDTIFAGAKVYNFGYGTQENVVLDIEVDGATSASDTIETFPNAVADTLSAGYVVSAVGTYTVNYALSATNEDTNPENNFASQSFEVTEYSYGRDNGVIFDTYGGDFEYACMPYYDIHNDATIYGIDVAIMDGGEAGSPIRAFVIDLDDPANLGSDGFLAPTYDMLPLAESGETYLNPDVSNSGTGEIVWYTFEFEEPLQATAGQVLGASFEYFGGAALTIAESSTNFDGTAAIYGPSAADGSYAWRGTDEMPMVRLNLDPNLEATEAAVLGCTDQSACNYESAANADDGSCLVIGEDCNDGDPGTFADVVTEECECEGTEAVNELEAQVGLTLFEAMPNPAISDALVQFQIAQSRRVSVEIRDLQGKVLETEDFGTLQPGVHNHTVDVTSWAAGTYSYTLVIDGVRATRKLMVK